MDKPEIPINSSDMWNDKFSREGYLYGTAPNAFLKAHIDTIEPGTTLLLLGEGEGRNACYAAGRKIQTTTIDASHVGISKTLALAELCNVEVDTHLMDLKDWEPTECYDTVMTSFLHLFEPLRTEAFRKVLSALKPGGHFIAEFFSVNQLPLASGGPKREDLLYTCESLREIFDLEHCEILSLEEVVDHLDEGPGHQGEAQLIRIRVRRR